MEVFQTFDYKGKVLQLATAEAESVDKLAKSPSNKAPGIGKFEIGSINLSAKKIVAGEEFTLTAQIKGKNIAYIYSEILFHDKDLHQFYGPVAREYIQADRNKESSGVSHPLWDDEINLTVRLNPSLRLLTDGADSAFGFLVPAGYGSSESHLDGLYIPVDGVAKHRAQITFDNAGKTIAVTAYKEQGRRVTPHALTFKKGGKFIPSIQILTGPAHETQNWQITKGFSTSLTFQNQPLCWIEESLMPGDYLVGLLVQDLDGGLTRKYAPLTVSE